MFLFFNWKGWLIAVVINAPTICHICFKCNAVISEPSVSSERLCLILKPHTSYSLVSVSRRVLFQNSENLFELKMPKNKRLGRGRVVNGRGRGRGAGYKKQLKVTLAEVECLAVIESIDQQLSETPPVLVKQEPWDGGVYNMNPYLFEEQSKREAEGLTWVTPSDQENLQANWDHLNEQESARSWRHQESQTDPPVRVESLKPKEIMKNLKCNIINGLADPIKNGEVPTQIREYLVGWIDIIQTLRESNCSFYGGIGSPTQKRMPISLSASSRSLQRRRCDENFEQLQKKSFATVKELDILKALKD